MTLSEHLIDQARRLASGSIGRPRQADLRRAVSSTYYALFHFVVDQSCRRLLGTQSDLKSARHLLSRAFDHATMKEVSAGFAGKNPPRPYIDALGGRPILNDVALLARVFLQLQQKRHDADYNLAVHFFREDVLKSIEEVESAMKAWSQAGSDVSATIYLLSMLLGRRVHR